MEISTRTPGYSSRNGWFAQLVLHETSRRRENVVYLSGRVVDEQADPFVHRNIKHAKAVGGAAVEGEVKCSAHAIIAYRKGGHQESSLAKQPHRPRHVKSRRHKQPNLGPGPGFFKPPAGRGFFFFFWGFFF